MTKTAIVLDADVIIHFSKANHLSTLPTIFPEYRMEVLSVVFDELKGDVKHQLEKMTIDDAHQFIDMVQEKGSKLPKTDFNTFISPTTI